MNKGLLNIPDITTYNTDDNIHSGNPVTKLDIYDKVSCKEAIYFDVF